MSSAPVIYDNADGQLDDSDFHNPCCHLWISRVNVVATTVSPNKGRWERKKRYT